MRVLAFANSVAGLVILTLAVAHAQEPDTLGAAQQVGFALARLRPGQGVRVHASGLGRLQGPVVNNSPNLLILATDGSQIEIPAPSIDSVWVRGRSHAGTGALIGAAVGGAAVGIAFSGTCGGDCGSKTGLTLIGVVVGAVPGSLVGALIGATVSKWQLRVP